MRTRKPLIVGAQKLYLQLGEAVEFAQQLRAAVSDRHVSFDIAICPSFINLAHVAEVLRGTQIGIGAQNVHKEYTGAFTGQVSIKELLQIGVRYVIVGHSELRREGETNGKVREKVEICLKNRVIPIVCVGEDRREREQGISKEVIACDIRAVFEGIDSNMFECAKPVVAYEPVWAIKAGKDDNVRTAAEPEIVDEMHLHIRQTLASIYGPEIARDTLIIYGGSVDADNAPLFLKRDSIEGLLVGSASIRFSSFDGILRALENLMIDETKMEPLSVSSARQAKESHEARQPVAGVR